MRFTPDELVGARALAAAHGLSVPDLLQPRCEECNAHVHEMRHLRFPVVVMVADGGRADG